MPTWYTKTDDGFQRADTSPGSAGTTTGLGNGWTDQAGGVAHIDGHAASITHSSTGAGYQVANISRPASEGSTNQRVVVYADLMDANDRIAVALRYTGQSAARYYGQFTPIDNVINSFTIDASNTGAALSSGSAAYSSFSTSHYYALEFAISGTSLTLSLYDLGTSPPAQTGTPTPLGSPVATATPTDSSIAGSSSSRPAIVANPAVADTPLKILRVITYTDIPPDGPTPPTLTTPEAHQVVQRSGTTGSIAISGTNADSSPRSIEANWSNSGTGYTTIAGNVAGGASFSGTLSGLPEGTGTLTVRYVDAPSAAATAANVGIGDVFLLCGQSNSSGRFTNAQTFDGGGVQGSLFGNDYAWKPLADWTDDNAGQADAVSDDGEGPYGSIWPLVGGLLARTLGVPIAFIPATKGGSGLTGVDNGNGRWTIPSDREDRTTLYGSAVHRARSVGGVKAVLWWQGETDARIGAGQSAYQSALAAIASAFHADLGVPFIPTLLQSNGPADPGGVFAQQSALDAINAAIAAAATANPSTMATPADLRGLTIDDGYAHLTTDANATAAARLQFKAIYSALYAVSVGTPSGGGITLDDLRAELAASASATATAILNLADGVEPGMTLRQALRRMHAVLAGRRAGGLFYRKDNTTVSLTAAVDGSGNRSIIDGTN